MDESFKTIEFIDNTLILIDQRLLPQKVEYFLCKTFLDIEFAIRDMVVRGAPAIGATAAYGVYLAAYEFQSLEGSQFEKKFDEAITFLNNSRPTAVNLVWATKIMKEKYESVKHENKNRVLEILLHLAHTIKEDDIAINKELSKIGSSVVPQKATILTHCNTGALATAGWGTALGIIKTAFYENKEIFVYADETRPRLQGARLTAWELQQANIPSTLISDSVAATLIRDGKIDVVILGADRVASNGDVCNKIGTFMLSALCKMYHVPFYSAAPVSTIDFAMKSGGEIIIEERDAREVTFIGTEQIAPTGFNVYNPAFDVTPHAHVTGIITEKGILRAPFNESIEQLRISLQK